MRQYLSRLLIDLPLIDHSLVLSLPLTINGLGYTAQQAQLLTIPVYTSALISILICSILADKYLIRLPFIVYP